MRYLIDGGLIHAEQVSGKQDIPLVGPGEVGGHLDVVTLAAEIHGALLEVVIVDYLLILVGNKVALRTTEAGCRPIHGSKGRLQILGVRHRDAA